MSRKTPEILAPVGTMEMCRAAVHNGADAIYVGMPGFNARGRAATLTIEELSEIITFCHRYDVQVFIAFNVLIFERELSDLLPALEEVIKLSPDAFIVQDLGLARLIRELAPHQPIHASTQMTITNAEAIEITADIGITRYVLGREVSIPEMQRIRAQTDKELEVFVHGALCVAYSGQCLTSERLGGRSANRGQCAQSCRLPYELVVDGVTKELGDRRYLVSPKDLCALEDVPQLMEAGIDSFKIEGRLKSPEYVASTVRSYKEAVTGSLEAPHARIAELSSIYSRGFFNGWMDGVNHQKLVDGRYGNHHGLELGRIVAVERDGVVIETEASIKNGDGVVFADFATEDELGGPVFETKRRGKNKQSLSFSRDFPLSRLQVGMSAFLNSSPALMDRWGKSFADRAVERKVSLSLAVTGGVGEPLSATYSDSIHSVTVRSEAPLQQAERAPLTKELVGDELGALGGTCFSVESFTCTFKSSVFLHNKELKTLRRRAIEQLELARTTRTTPSTLPLPAVMSWIDGHQSTNPVVSSSLSPSLSVLIREKEQLAALEGSGIETAYLDYEYGKEYGDSITELRRFGIKAGIATTRILKPAERGHLDYIRRLAPDVVLVRNLGALQYFQDKSLRLVGDFSLNVANSLTAQWMFQRKLELLCPSYDLNREQLIALLSRIGGSRCEVTVHQYMPAFHMEHCVFAAFLSDGTSYRDCGRPCERHRVELRDPQGALHPLKADAECRNTMFNGVPQSAARIVPELLQLGVGNFRLEALYESPEVLRRKIEAYISLVRGEISSAQLFDRVGVDEKYGVSEGQLLNIRSYKDKKKEHSQTGYGGYRKP